MSDSEQDLDECNFTDQVFYNQVEPFGAAGGGEQRAATRDSGMTTNINSTTMERAYVSAGTCTKGGSTSMSTQTAQVEPKQKKQQQQDAQGSDSDEAQRKPKSNPNEFEIVGLDKWLWSMYKNKLEKILDKNVQKNIFADYEVQWEDDDVEATEILYKLSNNYNFGDANEHQKGVDAKMKDSKNAELDDGAFDDDFNDYQEPSTSEKTAESGVEEQKKDNQFAVTSISWSCNGAILAVAYGKTDHVTWCEHKSVISTWRVFSKDLDTAKPNQTIETDNCCTFIQFHPENPLILAGGTVNGQIYIWNLDRNEHEQEICVSAADEYFHREPITKIVWHNYSSVHSLQSQYYLFTISTDGKILIWKYNSEYPEKSLAFPSKGHMLVSRKSNNDKVTILHGATALEGLSGASSLTDRNYLIGLHNGLVQRCTIKLPEAKDIRHFLQPRKDITWSDAAIHFMCNCYHQRNSQKIVDLVDNYMIDKKAYPRNVQVSDIISAKVPIQHLYRPFSSEQCQNYHKHYGIVSAISASPFNNRLFLTCSTDGQIRLYDSQETAALASFEPCFGEYINCVQWSPFRPSVFAACSNAGSLYIYDLTQSKQKCIEAIKHENSSISVKHRSAQQIHFNPKQRNLVAVGYDDKFVRVYKLSKNLANKTKNDHTVLVSFLAEQKFE